MHQSAHVQHMFVAILLCGCGTLACCVNHHTTPLLHRQYEFPTLLFRGTTEAYPYGFAAKVLELWINGRTDVHVPTAFPVLSYRPDWADAQLDGVGSFLACADTPAGLFGT